MNSEEFLEKIAQAVFDLHQEIKVTQMSQHLIAMQLSQLATDHALNLANTFENIANSEAVKTSEVAKRYLLNMCEMLRGSPEARIYGLEPQEKDPLHWLRGVIDGGKK